MNKVVLLCRPGFEKECAAEITDKAGRREIFGFARVKDNAGYVIFECYQQDDAEKLVKELPFSSLIFARQMFVVGELLQYLPPEDRITPIVGMLQGVVEKGAICVSKSPTPMKAKSWLSSAVNLPYRCARRCVKRAYWQNMKRRNVRWFMFSLSPLAVVIPVIPGLTITHRSTWVFRD